MRIVYIVILASIAFGLCINADAQTFSSPYSIYGIGVLRERTSSMNRAMGGTGFATRDPINLNNLNPAAYTSIQQATQVTEFGFFAETYRYGDGNESASSSTGNISNINIWLRFNQRWSGSVGMNPYSTVRYNIESSRAAGPNSDLKYSGSGGVTQFYFGNAFQVTKNLSLGVNASFLHGSIDKRQTIISGFASGTEIVSITYINRGNLDFGLQYTIPISADNSLTIGAVYDERLSLKTSQETTIYQQFDTLATDKTNVNDYVLPQKFGSGIAFQKKQSILTIDLSYQQWSKATLQEDLKLRNTRRASIGYQFRRDDSNSSLNGVVFKTGGYVQENPLVLQNETFHDWGLAVGIGLPVSNGRNTLSLSYNYNYTGTLAKNLISQQSHIFALDITFRDLWGIRRKFD